MRRRFERIDNVEDDQPVIRWRIRDIETFTDSQQRTREIPDWEPNDMSISDMQQAVVDLQRQITRWRSIISRATQLERDRTQNHEEDTSGLREG